jgi:hypothetical protein
MRRPQPRPQFSNRRVRPSGYLRPDFCVQIRQLRPHMTALRQRGRSTGFASSPKDLGDVGDTDAQQNRYLPNPITIVSGSENALPQIL